MHDIPIPPKSISEHNSRSIRNGILGEKYAEIHYQTTVCQNALIDGEYHGRPLEVKTCQVWIFDAGNARRRRRGRYYLRQDQHRSLVSKNGLYAFVLLKCLRPYCMIPKYPRTRLLMDIIRAALLAPIVIPGALLAPLQWKRPYFRWNPAPSQTYISL